MAKFVNKNATILLGSYDISGYTNDLSSPVEIEAKECTNYASAGYKEFLAGLRDPMMEGRGFLDMATVQAALFDMVSAGTLAPFGFTLTNPAAAGDVSYFFEAFATNLQEPRQVGELASWSAQFKSDEPLVRGVVLETTLGTARSSSGNSAALDLGVAIGSDEELVVAAFAVGKAGTSPTLDLVIASDDDGGFPSGTTRVTVPQFNDAIGSNIQYVAGPITDTHYRVQATLGGTDPEWNYIVLIGRRPAIG